jgi:GNAT superfamily N-acetyltransferase
MIGIREATPPDLAEVARLIRALATYERLADSVTWTEPELAEALFGPGAVPRVLIAELDGRVAGIAVWFRSFSTFLGRPGIWLEDLFVEPAHRGRGVGRALLEHLFQLDPNGRVEWAVLDWNVDAIEFYRRSGAAPVTGWTTWRRNGNSGPGTT